MALSIDEIGKMTDRVWCDWFHSVGWKWLWLCPPLMERVARHSMSAEEARRYLFDYGAMDPLNVPWSKERGAMMEPGVPPKDMTEVVRMAECWQKLAEVAVAANESFVDQLRALLKPKLLVEWPDEFKHQAYGLRKDGTIGVIDAEHPTATMDDLKPKEQPDEGRVAGVRQAKRHLELIELSDLRKKVREMKAIAIDELRRRTGAERKIEELTEERDVAQESLDDLHQGIIVLAKRFVSEPENEDRPDVEPFERVD